jgi:hypothetical protein
LAASTARRREVGVFQRGLPGYQGVHRDAISGGEVADGGGVQAGHDQRAVVLPGDGPVPLCYQLS